jgi:hypothetical protein
MQASNLLIRETKILAHAGIFRHTQKVLAATEFVPSTPLPTAVPALSRPAESTPVASLKLMRTLTPLVLSATTKLMLALPRAGPLWGGILRPGNNCCRQQNHKTQCPNRNFPSHNQFPPLRCWTQYTTDSLP